MLKVNPANTPNSPSFTGAKPIKPKMAKKIDRLLSQAQDMFCHASPDEDTTCAAFALSSHYTKRGVDIENCVNPDKLKGLLTKNTDLDIKQNANPKNIAVLIDFNTVSKLPKSYIEHFNKNYLNQQNWFFNLFKKSSKIIGFDHHQKMKDSIKGNIYIDKKANSACEIVYRYFEALGEKLDTKELQHLYCGTLSDFKKSKLVDIKDGKLIKLEKLSKDKYSNEILEKIESQLSEQEKLSIIDHLDVLSHLTEEEKAFRQRIINEFKISENGKVAYAIIDPQDKNWIDLGQDNTRTSAIIGDLGLKLIGGLDNNLFSQAQKRKFKNIESAIIFYRGGGAYQMSLHTRSKKFNAIQIIKSAKKSWNKYAKQNNKDIEWKGGGHKNRAGGRIFSLEENDVQTFISSYMRAFEKLDD